MFTRVSSATDAARLQTSTARNQQLIKRLSNRISHLKGEITKLRSALAMWRGEVGALPGFLREICRNTTIANDQKKTREWSASATSLAFVLDATSAKAYRFLKSLFALPAISVISEQMGPKIDSCERSILTTDDIGGAVQNWRIQWGVSVDEVVFAVLAGHGAAFNPQLLSQYRYPQSCTNVHAFMVSPINPRMRSFLVHILPHPSGSLGQSGAGLSRKIADILSVSKVHIILTATDGDRGYCPYQSQLIETYRDLFLGKQDIVSRSAAAFQHEKIGRAPV
jgi:hypothetical protein